MKALSRIAKEQIVVRYEDGSYAFVEQQDEPAVSKGDRVRVVEGRVEPRDD